MVTSTINRIALIGDYSPRQCGIATFTTDLAEALASRLEDVDVFATVVNDRKNGYEYPSRVRFEFSERDLASYHRAADFLNINNVNVVCVQHEYGIYGGQAGSHLIPMLKRLRMPIVSTLHTVLQNPTTAQRRVLKELASVSDRLVVMADRAVGYLNDIYDIPPEKVDVIHHGIPDVPFVDPNYHKDLFGVEGRTVLLTFGLISPNKGIEYAIEALPEIVAKHPNVVYLVQGATHPNLVASEGETYRLKLQRLAQEKGVESHVIFHNRFVNLDELVQYISAADLYILPYPHLDQMVSGTLAYSLGAGKAIVSTPIWYAQELLADGRGVVVPEREPAALAEAVNHLLDHEAERHAMRRRAYEFGRDMIWSTVADEYTDVFEKACHHWRDSSRPKFVAQTLAMPPRDLPPLKLDHLYRLSDETGLLQHATYSVPNYSQGYCVDDNARGLTLMVHLEEEDGNPGRLGLDLASRYMSFIAYAFNRDRLLFRNFMSYDRQWIEDVGSEDCQGRTIWALGTVIGRSGRRGLCGIANELLEQIFPVVHTFEAVRAMAFSLIGIHEYLRRYYGHRLAQDLRVQLAEELLHRFRQASKPDWPWCEDCLTYANAKVPHALLQSGRWLERGDMVEVALTALDWLCKLQHRGADHFVPIGSLGFYQRGESPARFDQQAIEAYSTIAACLEARNTTGDDYWSREAQRVFEWFLGSNDLGMPLYDPETGGCFDGLSPNAVNQNQGAESTLAFLLSLMEMRKAEHFLGENNGHSAQNAYSVGEGIQGFPDTR